MAETLTTTHNESTAPTEAQPKYFGLVGVAGYIAPKHLKAIKDTGNELVAALDPHDSVGILDSYFPQSRFFTEVERFDRYLEKRRRDPEQPALNYLSVCSPNYLHDAHVRLALRSGAHAICEKPLVINPWNLDQLEEIENESQARIYTVLQLRLHPNVIRLKDELQAEVDRPRHDVCLTYVTRRGQWYDHSWKGNEQKSGGLATNIGIHFFDLLLNLFGSVQRQSVNLSLRNRIAGVLEMDRARVRWFLSVDENDLPADVRSEGKFAYRSITVDGQSLDLSAGFTDLHTEVYRDILAGGGYGIAEARPAIDVVYQIRQLRESPVSSMSHPFLLSKAY
ncbi:MAG: Gfo/Idh/MocA family oxidoreductase [Pirellulales bacterium]|nr:Gfo/Idh/MocA family oxidoreductase [Pirellulales bacterium]